MKDFRAKNLRIGQIFDTITCGCYVIVDITKNNVYHVAQSHLKMGIIVVCLYLEGVRSGKAYPIWTHKNHFYCVISQAKFEYETHDTHWKLVNISNGVISHYQNMTKLYNWRLFD